MKELSIEEKAKRYDEALGKAKKELDACGSQDCDAARQIFRFFPELKGSEDERIRKWIIENIQETLDVDGFFEGQKTMAKDAIAWLEKQGVQKFVDKCKDCNNVKGCITCTDGDQYAHITEQKPADITDEWIEEYWQHEKVNNPYSYNKGDEIQFDYQGFVSFCKKYCQNPAWSEEDKENISMLIDLVESKEESMEVKIELSAWLKSLKERMKK